ncbi:MAG: carbohydate-binding domain-containing protein, partial [Hymenobacteraceae bacterium]|nr:carbohydate-binding domain-containing protein [Hymenobacteraceae bacterium]
MKKTPAAVLLALFVLLYAYSFAQENSTQFDPKQLQLRYEIADGKYQNKPQTLAVLTLTNTGKVSLPASGWALYFHSVPALKPKEENAPVKVEHVNGDLRYLIPTAAFKELAPGASQRIELVSGGQIVNDSRTPHSFYLVWDHDRTKGHATAPISVKKPDQPWVDWVQAKDIFEQNKVIQNIPEEKLTKVFPTPATYSETGKPFAMTAAVPIVTDAAFMREAALLADHFGTVLGKKPLISATGKGKAIRLQQKKGLGPEAYELQVSPQEVVIAASTPAGAFYGTQSLKTLIPAAALAKKQGSVSLPGVRVSDAPRFGHRAFMMDVSRNFQSKEQVLKVL